MTEITTIPALAAIVYTIIDIAKTALGGDERFKRFIPLIACILGAGCGVIAFYCVPVSWKLKTCWLPWCWVQQAVCPLLALTRSVSS